MVDNLVTSITSDTQTSEEYKSFHITTEENNEKIALILTK